MKKASFHTLGCKLNYTETVTLSRRFRERGYAIVRRASDGSIVRDPADAPPGTRLALRVARGELPASAARR